VIKFFDLLHKFRSFGVELVKYDVRFYCHELYFPWTEYPLVTGAH